MSFLSEWCPPQRFPANNNRSETQASPTWRRGGTSPSGESFGGARDADYFIGAQYLDTEYGLPQRIVWVPPRAGEESFVIPDSAGPHLERDNEDPARVFRRWATRVMPVTVDLWCNDFDDLDILLHWLCTAIIASNAGGPEAVGVRTLGSGGLSADTEMDQRGLRYRLRANFVSPISRPYNIQKPFQIVVSGTTFNSVP